METPTAKRHTESSFKTVRSWFLPCLTTESRAAPPCSTMSFPVLRKEPVMAIELQTFTNHKLGTLRTINDDRDVLLEATPKLLYYDIVL